MSLHTKSKSFGILPTTIVNSPILHQDKVSYMSEGGTAVIADSSPAPTTDNDARQGWLWKKTVADASKFNYYIFGSTGSSHAWKLSDLKSLHVTCSIDKWDSIKSAPFMVVYTVPTGSGDASWYKSKKAYTLTTAHKILVGEHVNLYFGEQPHLNNNNRYLHLDNVVVEGTAADDEQIFMISIHSDSDAPIATQILVSDAGYKLNGEIKRNIKFV